MNIQAAESLALQLMKEHNLLYNGWQFEWSRAVHQFGCCRYSRKLITLSRKLTECNEEAQVRDTILHEIAHALVGPGKGHGGQWKAMALYIGAKPERCYSSKDTVTPETRYHGICKDCQQKVQRVRVPRRSMLISGFHTKCRHKTHGGKIDWFCQGIRMLAMIERVPQPALAMAACNPEPEVKQDLSQSDITEMWNRLKAIDTKLSF